jgi:hypothetical protein
MTPTRAERRAQLIASFALHGWAPYSAMFRGQPVLHEVVLCDEDGAVLRYLRGKGAIYGKFKGKPEQLARRQPREWNDKDLTLPKLEALYERLVMKLTDDAAKERAKQAFASCEHETFDAGARR